MIDVSKKMKTESEKQIQANNSTMSNQEHPSQQSPAQAKPPETMEHGLSGFYQHQNETLRVHQHYLDQQAEYARTVYQLMQQRIELASQGIVIPPEVEQQMQMFHAHQSETLRIHEQYLNQQSEQTQSALKITELQLGDYEQKLSQGPTIVPVFQKATPVSVQEPVENFSIPIPVAVQHTPVSAPEVPPVSSPSPIDFSKTVATVSAPASSVTSEEVIASMMSIVSEKTGYPLEMLELGMDMEADLGIDSIKRVEILGAVQDKIPELPEVPGDELAEMRTLGQIFDYLRAKIGRDVSGASRENTSTVSTTDLDLNTQVQKPDTGQDLGPVFMTIISEKTGYPVEMLELGMDMEADLGIDSIKRVEIMWSLQEQLPHLPQVSGSEMSELRTLKEIVDHLSSLAPSENTGTTIVPTRHSAGSDPVKKNS